MKHRFLIAAAALAACGLAHAESGVALYGIVDAYVESLKVSGSGAGTASKLSSGGLAPSRWGLRGQEDLGGGLSARFILESGFSLDSGAIGSKLFSRQAWLGLGSKQLGEVRLGRQNATMLDSMVWTDGDYASNFSPITPMLLSNLDHLRQDNQLAYYSPQFGGFDAVLTVAPGEGATAAGVTTKASTGALLRYQSKELLVTAALHDGGQKGAINADQRAFHLGARYDFGRLVANAAYYAHRNELAAGPEAKVRGAVLSLYVPVGFWGFSAQYGYARDDGHAYATGLAKAGGKGSDSFLNIGALYNLSKRTLVYARYARASDSGNGFNGRATVAAYGIAGASSAMAANGSASTAAIGVMHRF